MRKLSTRSKLLVLGIIAQHTSVERRCTAYSIARALGYSHVTARKRLKILEDHGLLTSTIIPTAQGFGRVEYELSVEGMNELRKHAVIYAEFLMALFPF